MQAAETAESVMAARSAIERACRLFEVASPASLAAGTPVLEEAIANLENCRRGMSRERGMPPDRRDALLPGKFRQLRAELRRAGRLLESAASFYQGWERILGAMSGGYTAGGEPAPVVRAGKLFCQG